MTSSERRTKRGEMGRISNETPASTHKKSTRASEDDASFKYLPAGGHS